ncbi:SRPBCC family protein [Risungbinella massiliensis]|uniref:SRPBCC family protein n=1 Tax=Risungbinella massiliensis TaxID=1329796 RepID=UPI000699F996|nr:SRPBCC family protein [Risungbinella massiliensis]
MSLPYTIDIEAPIEIAFHCVNDIEKIKIWMPELVRTDYIGDYDKENPVGTKFTQKLKEGGRVVGYAGEILAYDKPRLLGIRIGNTMFQVEVYYRFEPITTGTRLCYECNLFYQNWLAQTIGKLFEWLNRRILTKQLNALKQLAEKESKSII